MSLRDRFSGRLKQAAGDLTGDEKLRRQGAREERKADARQELEDAEQAAASKRAEVSRLEYETSAQTASRRATADGGAVEQRGDDAERDLHGTGDDPLDPQRLEQSEP